MESLSLCRICLTSDVPLCPISSHLEDMYETITAMKFKAEDGRPLAVCYICHARLQNCYRLRKSCLRSEELLTEMMSSGEIQLQDVLSKNTFRVVSVLQLSLGHKLQDNTECHVKEVIHNTGVDHFYSEDPDNIKLEIEDIIVLHEPSGDGPSSQSTDSVCTEVNEPKTDAEEEIKLDIGETIIEGYDSNGAGSSQSADTLCENNPKTDNPVLKRLAESDPDLVTEVETENVVFVASNVHKTYSRTGAKLNKHEGNKAMAPHEVDKQTSEHNICSINEGFTETTFTDLCNKSSHSELYLRKHMYAQRHNKKKKQFYCDKCNKCFISKLGLTKHMYTHTGEKPFQCNVCNKWFRQKPHLTSHMYTHTGENPFKCDVCNKNFRRKISLKQHMYTHTGENPFKCEICNKKFTRNKSLIQHMYRHYKQQLEHKYTHNEKRFQCDVCLKYFKRKYHVALHMHSHTGAKFECDVCHKFFGINYKAQHMNMHTGGNKYICDVCKKCFTRRHVLIKHLEIHTRLKPYQCDVCDKCFISKQVLTKHMNTHTKQFQCDMCKKYYMQKHTLAQHMHIHTGEKRPKFKCDVCNKSFGLKSNLFRHIMRVPH